MIVVVELVAFKTYRLSVYDTLIGFDEPFQHHLYFQVNLPINVFF